MKCTSSERVGCVRRQEIPAGAALSSTPMVLRFTALALAAVSLAGSASAACVNRFLARTERPHQVVTLLTGKLTFQEAQALAKKIQDKQAPPIEWVDEKGRTLSRQFRDLKVVRPMPVGCDGKTSGVVMIVTFPMSAAPEKKMLVKLDEKTTVEFQEQAE